MPMSTEGTPAVNAYTATEQHMRNNYIASERRRNKYKGEAFFQSDEELGEEFDSGMRRIREDAARGGAQVTTGDEPPANAREGDIWMEPGPVIEFRL